MNSTHISPTISSKEYHVMSEELAGRCIQLIWTFIFTISSFPKQVYELINLSTTLKELLDFFKCVAVWDTYA